MRHSPWILASLLVIATILAGVASAGFDSIPTRSSLTSPNPDGPPAAPKTRDQIASEAYAIESSVKAIAGRKTDASNDGTGAETDYPFTSTGDFDAGTKSQTEGNYAVETITDNPVVSSGQFELASISGDAYTLSDADADTFKWDPIIGTGQGHCSRSISVGFAEIDSVANGNNANDCGISTHSTISGSFDARMKFDWSGTTKVYDLCVMDHQECNRITAFGGSTNGVLLDNLAGNLQPYKVISGVMTSLHSSTSVTNNPLWIRISRSGDSWTFYHSTDGSSWTTDFGGSLSASGIGSSLYVIANLVDNNYALPNVLKVDSYQMTAGTVDSGGYTSSGQWSSASQTATTETFKRAVITYSGATSGRYITAFTLFDSGGHYFFIDNTDLTSGSSHTYSISQSDSSTWKVGVNLTGDGSGSASVLSITVTTTGGLGTYSGCPPNPSGMTCTTNSTWDQSKVKLCGAQVFALSEANPVLHLTITNSSIDGCGLSGVFNTTDSTTSGIFRWDGIHSVNYTFRNSTFFNFTGLIIHYNTAANYRVGASVIRFDNVTMTDFGVSVVTANQAVARTILMESHDLNVSAYNRDDDASCALQDNPNNGPYEETLNATLYRSMFTDTSGHNTGCVFGDAVRSARDNYFEGGFLQLAYGSDFEHGVSPNFGSPTEIVNWSHNYANGSRHTVFGIYGTATGSFADHFGRNAYATIYANYINNSRYIPVQSSGNQSGVRIIGNYFRGPIPWPGGSPTFEFAVGIHDESHDYLISRNYFWDMDSVNIVGIDLGFAVYNMTVSSNVMYDVGGNFIRIEGPILKFKNDAICSPVNGCSDYSWKGSSLVMRGNYLAGGSTSRAISVDGGYNKFYNNTVVNAGTGTFILRKTLDCGTNCSFTWVDWIDGYPAIPTVQWSGTIPWWDEGRFWVRSMRNGGMGFSGVGSAFINITSSVAEWGNLSARCVDDGAATGGHTTTDQEVLIWSGHSCGVVQDMAILDFAVPGFVRLDEAMTFYNKTRTDPFNLRATADTTFAGAISVKQTDPPASYSILGNPWNVVPGRSYVVLTANVLTLSQGIIIDTFVVAAFLALLVLMVLGAIWIGRRRSHY